MGKYGKNMCKPVFTSIEMVIKVATQGVLRGFYETGEPNVKWMIINIFYALVHWMEGYLLQCRWYAKSTVEHLMQSFGISAVQLSEGTDFNMSTC